VQRLAGTLRRKCCEVSCHMKQTEPLSLWMNAAEKFVRELKKGLAQQMLKKHSPKRSWEHCLESQGGHVTSNRADNHFGLANGETQEAMISAGETANISEFAKSGWHNWINDFRGATVLHPEDNLVLDQCLGPAKHRHWSSHDGQDIETERPPCTPNNLPRPD
jgi:hypothetical protein